MTFEDDFPSFKKVIPQGICKNHSNGVQKLYCEVSIQSFCLDKQKVKDAIDKYIPKCYMDSRHYHKKDSCDFCKLRKELFGDEK